jgi:hypothetical protein
MRNHSSFYAHVMIRALQGAVVCICLSAPPTEAASPEVCSSPAIEFAPLEPQELTWWTGRKQTSKLTENGVPIASIALSYRNSPFSFGTSDSAKKITIGSQRFRHDHFYHENAYVNWSSSFPATGVIDARSKSRNASAEFALAAKQFQTVIVHFDYDSTRDFRRVLTDIYCFLESPTLAAGLK